MAGAAAMVDVWGNILSLAGNMLAIWAQVALLDAFFPRRKSGKAYCLWVAAAILAAYAFSLFVGSRYGYTLKFLFETASYYVLSAILYQSRWDRRLFVVVTNYAVLYSCSYWFDALCLYALGMTYEEYVWNIPLYSATFFLRPALVLAVARVIRKHHPPLSVGEQARAWVPLSAVFPLVTLLFIWLLKTFPNEQPSWQVCLLILDVVDVSALLLLDHLEQSALDREKLVAAAERARVQDENIQALSQAYAGQRKMTHDYRAQLSALSELLDGGDLEQAKAYLSEMKARQSERILLVNTRHAALDAVLNEKGYAGQRQGIDMRFRVNDLSPLKLSPVDVTIVLGNLLDNAMEACLQLPEEQRWVSVQLLYGQGVLSLCIVNPSRPVRIVDGQIATTKPEPLLHGFGLRNVQDILNKYHAEYDFSFEDGRFLFTADWPDNQR